jgi:hypothetical protein
VIARRDGKVLWPERTGRAESSIEDARRFGERLAGALGVAPELQAAFEDPWEVVREEAQLPPEIDFCGVTCLCRIYGVTCLCRRFRFGARPQAGTSITCAARRVGQSC